MAKATSGQDTTTGQRMLLIASTYSIPHMCVACVGINGNSAVENVVPVTIGVAMGVELVSLNLSTMAWMYTL